MVAVEERSDAGGQFSFLGANQDAIREWGNLGVDTARAMTYSAAPQGGGGGDVLAVRLGQAREDRQGPLPQFHRRRTTELSRVSGRAGSSTPAGRERPCFHTS